MEVWLDVYASMMHYRWSLTARQNIPSYHPRVTFYPTMAANVLEWGALVRGQPDDVSLPAASVRQPCVSQGSHTRRVRLKWIK